FLNPSPGKVLRVLICLLLSLLPVSGLAQDDFWSTSVFLENDLFANTDMSYTNGVRLSWISPDVDEFMDVQGRSYPWVARLNQSLEFLHPRQDNTTAVRNVTINVGQLMFTPADRLRSSLDPDDRPYAGWLYLGIGYQARSENTLHAVEVNLGVVGPAALARQSQNAVHNLMDIEEFRGWHNQLKNEPGLQVAFERKHRHGSLPVLPDNAIQLDLITHWGGSLGNIRTDINAGAEVRLGRNLPLDFGASSLRPGGDTNSPGRPDVDNRLWQWHGFIATNARAVARNIFLDGNTFRRSHSVDRKTLVADTAIGFTLARKRWRLTYAHVYRTREFTGQQEPQLYGALTLTYSRNLGAP
ncbi:MAG: lipid A deacylase LpxR family protein, partial [Pseudohongiellaceae bacterium]